MGQFLQQLFYPRTLVVVGVSDSLSNLARHIIENLDSADSRENLLCRQACRGTQWQVRYSRLLIRSRQFPISPFCCPF